MLGAPARESGGDAVAAADSHHGASDRPAVCSTVMTVSRCSTVGVTVTASAIRGASEIAHSIAHLRMCRLVVYRSCRVL